jgi:hypothetical protein
MGVRRAYVIALALVVLGAVVTAIQAAQPSAEQASQALAQRDLPEAIAALQRLRVPADFHPLRVGCRWYRCYLIRKPTSMAAPVLPMIMRNLGASNPETRRLQAEEQAMAGPLDREANGLLQRLGVRAGPIKIASCDAVYTHTHGEVVHCASQAMIDHNLVIVFLVPYFGCPPGRCHWTNETELDISFRQAHRQRTGG